MTTYAWIHETRAMLPGEAPPLTPREHEAITRAKLSVHHHALMDIKHMAERQIPIETSEDDTHFWLFYLPDFTRLFKDWYREYIEHIFRLYRPRAEAALHYDDKWLLLRYQGERPRDLVEKSFVADPSETAAKIIHNAERAQMRAQQAIAAFETAVGRAHTPLPFTALIEAVTDFAAHGLDNVFPESLLTGRFPSIELSRVYWTPVSSWHELSVKATDSLERVYVGEELAQEAIKTYAREVSFLRWGDIESAEADLAWSERFFNNLRREFPNYVTIWEHRMAERDRLHLYGTPRAHHERYLDEFRRKLSGYDCELFDALTRTAAAAQRYNEVRRMIFTKTLRLVRDLASQYHLDWRRVSLTELENIEKEERRTRYEKRDNHLQGAVSPI